MASGEALLPTLLKNLVNVSGTIDDVSNGPDTPSDGWLTEGDDALDTGVTVEFATPVTAPGPGQGLQTFRLWCRRSLAVGGNDPALDVFLFENAVEVAKVGNNIPITSTAGQLVEVSWDGDLLTTADGSAIELKAVGNASTGPESSRRTVEFGEFEFATNRSNSSIGVELIVMHPDAEDRNPGHPGTWLPGMVVSSLPPGTLQPGIYGHLRHFIVRVELPITEVDVEDLVEHLEDLNDPQDDGAGGVYHPVRNRRVGYFDFGQLSQPQLDYIRAVRDVTITAGQYNAWVKRNT